jgi:hypothetical protein
MSRSSLPRHRDAISTHAPDVSPSRRRSTFGARMPAEDNPPFLLMAVVIGIGLVLLLASLVGNPSGLGAHSTRGRNPLTLPPPVATSTSPAPGATGTPTASIGAPVTFGPLATATTPAVKVPPPAAKAVAKTGRVTVCGQFLCRDGSRWVFYGASVFGSLDQPSRIVSLASSADLNVIHITDFLDDDGSLDEATDEKAWREVDSMIAAAGHAGLHAEIDLSGFLALLKSNDKNPFTFDWEPFLRFVTNRVNTVSGRTYKKDPTISIIALAGKADAPSSDDDDVSTGQITSFFSRTLAQLAALAPDVVRSSGGLLHLEPGSGIDWQAIMRDPNNQVCEVRVYKDADRTAASNVADFCGRLKKPWLIEEFGFDQKIGDSKRAGEFQKVYDLERGKGGSGAAFWNLGFEIIGEDGKKETFDVNTKTPLTFRTVQRNAP